MSQTHYKLPLDDEIDKDIITWINSFSRSKKGEMVRHAIRYYMLVAEDKIKFPNMVNEQIVRSVPVAIQKNEIEQLEVKPEVRKRQKPKFNPDAIKGK